MVFVSRCCPAVNAVVDVTEIRPVVTQAQVSLWRSNQMDVSARQNFRSVHRCWL